ncbi:MAG: hypothetical protein CBC09_01060 [Cellvibrionales bacterium TMED49]|nr:flagellin FliC [Porticoccaceae bacterium]OUU40027.1 MAG: hypothetical protein CBC09_01060 [Cellvibrionales bacterium TMED49]
MDVNTNSSAHRAASYVAKNERVTTEVMHRLSTGVKINSAIDDPAGWTISSKMTSALMSMKQALRNAYDGISMLETASGATAEMGNMVQRVRELTLQGISDSSTPAQRAMMQNEADELIAEIENIARDTQFNNRNLLDGSSENVKIQTGSVAGQTFDVSIYSLTTEDLKLKGLDIITNPSEALAKVDAAVSQVVGAQSQFGVNVALLNQAVESLLNSSLSFEAARGRIIDANFAHDTTTLASKTIMGEAAMAMVSQANQQPKAVHHLLKVESNKSF